MYMCVCMCVCVCVGGDSPSSIIYRKPSCICDFQRQAEKAQQSSTDLLYFSSQLLLSRPLISLSAAFSPLLLRFSLFLRPNTTFFSSVYDVFSSLSRFSLFSTIIFVLPLILSSCLQPFLPSSPSCPRLSPTFTSFFSSFPLYTTFSSFISVLFSTVYNLSFLHRHLVLFFLQFLLPASVFLSSVYDIFLLLHLLLFFLQSFSFSSVFHFFYNIFLLPLPLILLNPQPFPPSCLLSSSVYNLHFLFLHILPSVYKLFLLPLHLVLFFLQPLLPAFLFFHLLSTFSFFFSIFNYSFYNIFLLPLHCILLNLQPFPLSCLCCCL